MLGETLMEAIPQLSDEPPSTQQVFTQQAEALASAGVDVLWIETIFAFDELRAALAAAASTGLPVASTMTFDTVGRTMMGDTPQDAVEFFHAASPRLVAYGANCGAGPAMLIDTICGFQRVAASDDVIISKGNCGVPELKGGELRYSGTEEVMAAYARMARDSGARIVGGCCGTTPKHLKAIADAIDGYTPKTPPDREAIEAALGPIKAQVSEADSTDSTDSRNSRAPRRAFRPEHLLAVIKPLNRRVAELVLFEPLIQRHDVRVGIPHRRSARPVISTKCRTRRRGCRHSEKRPASDLRQFLCHAADSIASVA